MNSAWNQIKTLVWNVFNRPTVADLLDIFIVAYLLYKLLMLTKETRASAVLKGFVMLIAVSWISDLLGLTALSWVLQNVVSNGAVVIRGDRIMAAACILTLSEGKGISRELGTRHRAAIGITETTDAIALIVSEETGIISMAREGRLTRHLDRAGLEQVLTALYQPKENGLLSSLMEKTKRRKGDAA